MTRQNVTGMIHASDPLPVALELIQAFATSVLGEHTDQAGWCVDQLDLARVVLAALNLAVI